MAVRRQMVKEQWVVAQRLTDTCLSSYKIVKFSTVWDFMWVAEAIGSCTHVFSGNIVVVNLFCHNFEKNGCLCVQSRVTKWQPCTDGHISMWWDNTEFYPLVDVGQNTRFVTSCTSLSVRHSDDRKTGLVNEAVVIPTGNTPSSHNLKSPTIL